MSEVLDTRLSEIDKEAERKRASAIYISDLIEANREKLLHCFIVEEVEPNDPETELFDKVEKAILGMQSNALRRVGVVLTYIVPGSNAEEYDPTVKAGWRQYVPALPFHDDTDMTKEFPHVIRLTQEGLDVIDNWRSAQGYVSLDEQWRLNKERDEAVRHA